MADHIRDHIMKNCDALQRLFPQLLLTDEGWCALRHAGEIVTFYATMPEAFRAGQQVYRDSGFSGHAVTAGATEG
jgi:hypothetical protein